MGCATDQFEITTILGQWAAGDRAAIDRLFPMLYENLHRIAASQLVTERKGHTLQATALVNEAYLKLINQNSVRFQNRSHFLALSAMMMRRVLVDYAKTKRRKKRDGTSIAFNDDIAITPLDMEQLFDFDVALHKLEQLDPRQVRIIELRFFGGLSNEEVADALGVSTRTVENDWHMARAWLKRELEGKGICL